LPQAIAQAAAVSLLVAADGGEIRVGIRWTRTGGLRVDFENDEGLKRKTAATYVPTYRRIAILLIEIEIVETS
jgi:hypothetical protein